jgi:p-hydroxybenzoate 3-monooxygenase
VSATRRLYGRAKAPARVRKGPRFSWWMATLLHQFPDANPYARHMQSIEFAYLFSSRASHTSLAENCVGLPF